MNKKVVLILTIVIVVLLFIIIAMFYQFASENVTLPPDTPQVEKKQVQKNIAPDFTLKSLDGRTVSLSDYVGKSYVVLNFWASWCPPCRQEMPHFNKLEKTYADQNVVFLMVNLTDGQRETKQIALKYIADNKFTFQTVLFDEGYQASSKYNTSSIPATFFINIDGNIVNSHIGSMNEQTLIQKTDNLIK